MVFDVLIIALAFTWPTECDSFGRLYRQAAELRDTGITLEEALAQVRQKHARRALATVYTRPEMTPDQWKFYIIGVCVGVMDQEERAPKVRQGPVRPAVVTELALPRSGG